MDLEIQSWIYELIEMDTYLYSEAFGYKWGITYAGLSSDASRAILKPALENMFGYSGQFSMEVVEDRGIMFSFSTAVNWDLFAELCSSLKCEAFS